jgi:hypothetical protein
MPVRISSTAATLSSFLIMLHASSCITHSAGAARWRCSG